MDYTARRTLALEMMPTFEPLTKSRRETFYTLYNLQSYKRLRCGDRQLPNNMGEI